MAATFFFFCRFVSTTLRERESSLTPSTQKRRTTAISTKVGMWQQRGLAGEGERVIVARVLIVCFHALAGKTIDHHVSSREDGALLVPTRRTHRRWPVVATLPTVAQINVFSSWSSYNTMDTYIANLSRTLTHRLWKRRIRCVFARKKTVLPCSCLFHSPLAACLGHLLLSPRGPIIEGIEVNSGGGTLN